MHCKFGPKFSFQNSWRIESCIPFHKASQKSKPRHSTIISFLVSICFKKYHITPCIGRLHPKYINTVLLVSSADTAEEWFQNCVPSTPGHLCSRFLFLWMITVITNLTESLPQPGMWSLVEWKFQDLRSESSSTNSQILVLFITEPQPNKFFANIESQSFTQKQTLSASAETHQSCLFFNCI